MGFAAHLKFSAKQLRWNFLGFYSHGEFDPGSGRTLAECLIHASRTKRLFREYFSGGRVSNALVICLRVGDNVWKRALIPHMLCTEMCIMKDLSL
jgi:hypothetical protein